MKKTPKTIDSLSLTVPGKLGKQLAAMGFDASLVFKGPLAADDVARARAIVSTMGTWERMVDGALKKCASLAPVDRPQAPAKKASKK